MSDLKEVVCSGETPTVPFTLIDDFDYVNNTLQVLARVKEEEISRLIMEARKQGKELELVFRVKE